MSLCGDVDAAGIRMPLHRFAGTIRRNKHRDDRAHGRLQNPLAQNDVRAGDPSRRWEARWNNWKGQQNELDEWIDHYNNERTHQGKICEGRTPMQTLEQGKAIWRKKFVA